jgi:hypothetical protein
MEVLSVDVLEKVLDRFRGLFAVERDGDIPEGGLDHDQGLAHGRRG